MSLHWSTASAFCDAPDLTVLRIRGRDHLTYLQTKLTADTRTWAPDGGGYAFATDINGRVLFGADFHRLANGEETLAVLASDQAPAALAHLEKWVIMEDVTIVSDPDTAVWVVAPATELPALDPATLRFRACHGDLVLLPRPKTEPTRAALVAAGIASVSRTEWLDAQLPDGPPIAGIDLRIGETIPLEAGAFHAISFNKGCYLGQEVIERLHSRGRPAKRLMHVEITGPPPAPETPLLDGEERDAGWCTRAVPIDDTTSIGFAYIRRRYLDEPPLLRTADGHAVRITGYVGGERPPASAPRRASLL